MMGYLLLHDHNAAFIEENNNNNNNNNNAIHALDI